MKKIILLSIFIILVSSPAWATNEIDNNPSTEDIIIINNGMAIKGHIIKFGNNSFKVDTSEGLIKVSNNDVVIISIGQDLTDMEKFRLGKLDGKRYAKNKVGNWATGFFFSILGTGIVYLTSNQLPSYKAMLGANKPIVDDMNYIMGYEKGAKNTSGSMALYGTLTWLILLLL